MTAIVRQLHRPSVAGGVTALSRTTRTASGGTAGLRPRPVAPSNPARRLARNRWHQRLTVTRDTPTRAAIWCCEIPAALSTTISARCRSRTATVDALIRRSNSPLSWPLSTILLRATAPPNGRSAACPKAPCIVKLLQRHYTSLPTTICSGWRGVNGIDAGLDRTLHPTPDAL